MPGEEDGVLGGARGGRVPGPLGEGRGLIVTETGSIGLQTPPPHKPLSKPSKSSQWELRRYGKAEIGFYCDSYTPNDTLSVTEIRKKMGHSGASACVLIGYEVSFPRSAEGSDVFQAFGRLTISGPFLPLEVKNKTAQRRVKPAAIQPPPADDPKMWEKARDRLLQHEVGHITQAWRDLLAADLDFGSKFDNNPSLTYEEFERVVIKSESTMTSVLGASGTEWDDRDLGDTTSYIKDLWIYMPIKKPGEPQN
ncbi:MAG: hypothetical protein HZB55_11865 [Deltaproteobacteria bacterium]|nr:hypothetical protein [Deltaproteobacteria bacterium]